MFITHGCFGSQTILQGFFTTVKNVCCAKCHQIEQHRVLEKIKFASLRSFSLSRRQCNVRCLIYSILMLVRQFISCMDEKYCTGMSFTFQFQDQQNHYRSMKLQNKKGKLALKYTSKAMFQCSFSCPNMAICPCAIFRPKKTFEPSTSSTKNCAATTIPTNSILFHFN